MKLLQYQSHAEWRVDAGRQIPELAPTARDVVIEIEGISTLHNRTVEH